VDLGLDEGDAWIDFGSLLVGGEYFGIENDAGGQHKSVGQP
jgi:hypothetical protein